MQVEERRESERREGKEKRERREETRQKKRKEVEIERRQRADAQVRKEVSGCTWETSLAQSCQMQQNGRVGFVHFKMDGHGSPKLIFF